MELAHIPQQAELNSIFGNWNPTAYYQGMKNQDLQGLFNEQGRQFNEQEMAKRTMEQEQQARLNPLLVTQQTLMNQGKDLANVGASIGNKSSQIDLDKKTALKDQDMETERMKLRQQYSDSEIAEMSDRVLRDHLTNVRNGDRVGMAKTGPLLEFLAGATAGKVADRAMDRYKTDTQSATDLRTTGMRTSSAERINQAQIDAGKYDKANKLGLSFTVSLMKQKVPERLGSVAAVIETGRFPDGTSATPEQLETFRAMFDQDVRTAEGQQWAKNQGIQPSVDTTGRVVIENKPQPNIGGKKPQMSDDDLINKYK